jgi:DNA-binding NarL/FixJ family response regulator
MVMRNWLLEAGTAPPTANAPPPANVPLEPEDRQILRLIALGVPTWRIAADLRRGVKVVEKYRATLMRRLNLSSTAAVTRYAVSCNLLSREEVDQLVSTE